MQKEKAVCKVKLKCVLNGTEGKKAHVLKLYNTNKSSC